MQWAEVFKLLLLVIHKGCHLCDRYTMTKMEKKKKDLLNYYTGRIFFLRKKIVKISNPLNTWPQTICSIVQENLELEMKVGMFMDWKNQYSENEYTTQSNL